MTTRLLRGGVDVGNVRTKGQLEDLGVEFPSVVAGVSSREIDFSVDIPSSGKRQPANGQVGELASAQIGIAGDWFLFGDAAIQHGVGARAVMDRSRVGGDDYKRLLAACVGDLTAKMTDRNDVALELVLSLPVEWYRDEREQLRQRIPGTYDVTIADRHISLHITDSNLYIIIEGLGALAARIFDNRGMIVNDQLYGHPVGVIDVGGQTISLVLFNQDLTLDGNRSASLDGSGVRQIASFVKGRLSERYHRTFSIEEIEKIMRDGNKLMIGNQQVTELGVWIEEASAQVADQVVGNIQSLWDGGTAVHSIIITGGGANYIRPTVEAAFSSQVSFPVQFPHLRGVSQGFENVTGAYRLLLGAIQYGFDLPT